MAACIPERLKLIKPTKLIILVIWLISIIAVSPDFTGLRGRMM